MNYRIGTRGSPLALWQARRVAELLRGVDPSSRWEICEINPHLESLNTLAEVSLSVYKDVLEVLDSRL